MKKLVEFEQIWHKTSEEALIRFLRTHKAYSLALKNALDREDGFIQTYCVDLAVSWQFYNEFKKMHKKRKKA